MTVETDASAHFQIIQQERKQKKNYVILPSDVSDHPNDTS
jgi:hypothetical protein